MLTDTFVNNKQMNTHDITHRIHDGRCLTCITPNSTGANPPPQLENVIHLTGIKKELRFSNFYSIWKRRKQFKIQKPPQESPSAVVVFLCLIEQLHTDTKRGNMQLFYFY